LELLDVPKSCIILPRDIYKYKRERTGVGSVGNLELLLGSALTGVAGHLMPISYEDDQHTIPQPLVMPPTQLLGGLALEIGTSIEVIPKTLAPTVTITEELVLITATRRVPVQQDGHLMVGTFRCDRISRLAFSFSFLISDSRASEIIPTFASAVKDANIGAVGIELDPQVAARVQELLSKSNSSTCELGNDFFNPINVHVFDLADITCGTQNLLVDSIGREGYAN
jgi:hypothetical protein